VQISSNIRGAARRFLASRHPVVLLSVPGCGPCALSPAHSRRRDLLFPDARRILVKNEVEFMALITWISTGRQQEEFPLPARLRKALGSIACYCAKVFSITALRQRDCVHESHFRRFLDYNGALLSLPGWEFNLIPGQSTKRSRRVYKVLRTHSRLLAAGPSPVLDTVNGLLEVRFVGSQYLRLIVDGLPDRGHLRAHVELRQDGLSPLKVLAPFTRQIDRSDLSIYQIVDEHLERAFSEPARAAEILQEAAASLSHGDGVNYPVIEIIADVMQPAHNIADISHRVLKQRIQSIRARLWDGPVIAGYVRSHLDSKLASPSLTRSLANLPLDIQADLAAVTMPLTKLEAGDYYLDDVAETWDETGRFLNIPVNV
jgi:hypothetical protein